MRFTRKGPLLSCLLLSPQHPGQHLAQSRVFKEHLLHNECPPNPGQVLRLEFPSLSPPSSVATSQECGLQISLKNN